MEVHTVVSMGCGDNCPNIKAKDRVQWNIPDPNMQLDKKILSKPKKEF